MLDFLKFPILGIFAKIINLAIDTWAWRCYARAPVSYTLAGSLL